MFKTLIMCVLALDVVQLGLFYYFNYQIRQGDEDSISKATAVEYAILVE